MQERLTRGVGRSERADEWIMRITICLSALILNCLAFHSALAQNVANLNGSYSATESWSVTLHLGNGTAITSRTYTGKETGTLTISDGVYTQINHTGAEGVKDATRTIYSYTINGTTYDIGGTIPLSGIISGPGGELAAEIRLTYFVIKVPLPSTAGWSLGDGGRCVIFDAEGTSLASLSGSGKYVDGNDPTSIQGYLNEVDASSTAGITPAPVTEYSLTIDASTINEGSGLITSQPAGIDCGNTCTYEFDSGAQVTLTAAPGAATTFGGWSGACTGTGTTCTVTMSSAETVKAIFAGPLPLSSGWNLISLPLQPATGTTVASALSGISGQSDSVWGYAGQTWQFYDPNTGDGALATALAQAGMGYWIHMTASGETLPLSGSGPSSSASLLKGWNLVGYNGTSCVAPSTGLSSLSSSLQVSWGYSNQSWKVYDPNDPAGSTLTQVCPGEGYWIKVNRAGTWTLP